MQRYPIYYYRFDEFHAEWLIVTSLFSNILKFRSSFSALPTWSVIFTTFLPWNRVPDNSLIIYKETKTYGFDE